MTREPVAAIVQARMSSRRAPGKMLREVGGQPVLQYVLERLQHCAAIGDVVVATSVDKSDDAIAEFCEDRKIACVRGPLEDVAGRFLQVLNSRAYPAFARICGDRAMLAGELLERAVSLLTPDVDLVTNTQPKTFPAGQTVELVRSAALVAAYPQMIEDDDREHVTRYFYRRASQFRIANFALDRPANDVHLAIDTEDDLQRFGAIVQRMNRPHWTYTLSEIVTLYRDVVHRG